MSHVHKRKGACKRERRAGIDPGEQGTGSGRRGEQCLADLPVPLIRRLGAGGVTKETVAQLVQGQSVPPPEPCLRLPLHSQPSPSPRPHRPPFSRDSMNVALYLKESLECRTHGFSRPVHATLPGTGMGGM